MRQMLSVEHRSIVSKVRIVLARHLALYVIRELMLIDGRLAVEVGQLPHDIPSVVGSGGVFKYLVASAYPQFANQRRTCDGEKEPKELVGARELLEEHLSGSRHDPRSWITAKTDDVAFVFRICPFPSHDGDQGCGPAQVVRDGLELDLRFAVFHDRAISPEESPQPLYNPLKAFERDEYVNGDMRTLGSRTGACIVRKRRGLFLGTGTPPRAAKVVHGEGLILDPYVFESPDDGMEIATTDLETELKTKFEPILSVAFAQIPGIDSEPATSILRQMRDLVRDTLVDFERTFFARQAEDNT